MNAVTNKSEVFERLREHHAKLAAHGVKRIGLFGSFVKDEVSPDSDVDLLVEFAPGAKTFDRFMELSFLLEDILQRSIDLVTVESLSPHVGPRILESVEYVSDAA